VTGAAAEHVQQRVRADGHDPAAGRKLPEQQVNPALASIAVGVVPHRAAGMASGINSTFRQVGVATGIAVFGTLLAARVGRRPLAQVPRAVFVSGLNEILVVSGVGALVAAVAALALIRARDFALPAAPPDLAQNQDHLDPSRIR